MKRLLVVLALLVLCVGTASAGFSYNFQNADEFGGASCLLNLGGTCNYITNTTGGNSYILTSSTNCGAYAEIYNEDPEATTYAAATVHPTSGIVSNNRYVRIRLYDSTFTPIYSPAFNTGITTPTRFEMRMDGNIARIYKNGVLVASSGALATNPSYVSFGVYISGDCPSTATVPIDDFVYGASESKTVFGNPERNAHVVKDLFNPANSGLMNMTTGTIYSSNNMSTSFSRSNTTIGTPMSEETVQLLSFSDGSVRQSWTLRQNDYTGQLSTPLSSAFFNTGAPYGAYTVHIPGDTYYPNIIYYTGYGADIAFDRDTYSQGTTATMTYSVDGGAWDPATYDYAIKVTDLYGTELSSQPLVSQTGTKTYTWASDQAVATYFAWVYATPKAGGDAVPIGLDSATVNAYVIISGWVNDGETQFKIPVANVNFYQGSTPDYITTAVDGNYSTTQNFLTGSQIIINVTATGYRPYQKNFTPIASVANPLNFTLVPNSPVTTGLALGGVVREGDGQGATTSIPPKPIANATVQVWNTTYGESWTVEGNRMGYYLLDQSKGATLTSGRLYEMSATRGGYTNFSIYERTVTG